MADHAPLMERVPALSIPTENFSFVPTENARFEHAVGRRFRCLACWSGPAGGAVVVFRRCSRRGSFAAPIHAGAGAHSKRCEPTVSATLRRWRRYPLAALSSGLANGWPGTAGTCRLTVPPTAASFEREAAGRGASEGLASPVCGCRSSHFAAWPRKPPRTNLHPDQRIEAIRSA